MSRKRILAAACVAILVVNQITTSVGMFIVEANSAKNVTLNEDFVSGLVVSNKKYDGTMGTEVDCSGVELVGKNTDDKVWLAATASFEDANAGENKNVTVTDFHLEGADAEGYTLELMDEQRSVSANASINPAMISIIPNGIIVEGEQVPKEIEYTWDGSEIVESDKDSVTVSARLYIDKNEDNGYIYTISDGNAITHPNYTLYIDSSYTPVVEVPEAAIITSVGIEKKSASELLQYDFGIVSNDSVKIVITAEEKNDIPMKFELSDGQIKMGTRQEVSGGDIEQDTPQFYIYSAEFDIELEEGQESKDITLSCIVDNGTKSQEVPLQLSIDGQRNSSRVIIDKVSPYVKTAQVKYEDAERRIKASAVLSDTDSGIKTIKYKWDDADKWQNYEKSFSNEPNSEIFFEIAKPYSETEFMHELHFFIEDNAGNTIIAEGKYCESDNGPDAKAPKVNYINLKPAEETILDKVLKIVSFGNYTNDTLELLLKVEDQSYSGKVNGVKLVQLVDEHGEYSEIIQSQEGTDAIEHIYKFVLKPDQVIENWYIQVTDNHEFSNKFSVLGLLQSEIAETGADDSLPEDDTVNSIIDWNKIQSNRWILDSLKPAISVDYSEANNQSKDNTYYYNNEGGIFSVEIEDNCCLEYVTISRTYKRFLTDEGETETVVDQQFFEETKNYRFEVDTSDSNMRTGWYTYTVSATDYASFLSKEEHSEEPQTVMQYGFYVDHELPEGRIEVISPALTKIGEENWVKNKDDKGENLPITLRLYAEPKGADLFQISLDVNSEKNCFKFAADSFMTDENGNTYVDVIVNSDEIKYDEENIYTVNAEITSASMNKGHTSYVLHVDTENPIIDKFTVEKKDVTVDTILNVLTFGTFSNGSIILTIDVKDGKYDSGIDYVTISYEGLNKPVQMQKREEGKYFCELDIDTKVFQSNIIVTAYDKVGKRSLSCPNIENTEGGKGVSENCFVMLEKNAPKLVVDLPETDSTGRTDNQIWYRKHLGDENDPEKFIEVVVQDIDAGVRSVEMKINGISVNSLESKIERDGTILPTIEITENQGKINRQELCKEFHYYFSTDRIAETIPENEDGSYVIEVKVVDNAGNVTTSPINVKGNAYKESKVIYYRDDKKPNVVQFVFDPISYDNINEVGQDNFIESLEYGYYFKREFNVTIVFEDPIPSSHLEKAVFRLVPYENGQPQKEETYTVPIEGGKASYTIPAGFKGQIYGKAYDKVGNISQEKTPQGFVSDATAPIITIEPLSDKSAGIDNNGNRIFTEEVKFRVTISDMDSGLRTISYSKKSEIDTYDTVVTNIENGDGKKEEKILANEWQIIGTDNNLVTMVTREFTFDKDDNDITMKFSAVDRSGNGAEQQESETFTIDTIAPQITITNNSEVINDEFYNGSTTFTIVVKERNFSSKCMDIEIKNSYTSAIPIVDFIESKDDVSVHTAVVTFQEGDYEFGVSGTDLGGHKAGIAVNGEQKNEYFFTTFNVDATSPKIETNFSDFGVEDDREIYFNTTQIAEITVTEHNFYESDLGITVMEKMPGGAHIVGGTEWYSIGYVPDWEQSGNDTYTLHIPFERDGVYRITIDPIDRANNVGVFVGGSANHTAVYELDMTPPEYYGRNDDPILEKDFTNTPFYDVYDEKRKDENPPSVEFEDTNFDRIEIESVIYTPTYKNGMELGEITKSPLSDILSKSVSSKKFTLTDFEQDGVYALKFVAYDKAGNKSEEVSNTYFRMIDTDVLAYIYNSNIIEGTGYYSLMNESDKAISKKATDFDDLDVLVIKPIADTKSGKLLLREDEKVYSLEEYSGYKVEKEAVSETASLVKIHLPGEYFSETFKDDGLDTRMYLSVSIHDDVFLDLASIHIDNEAPTAELPKDFVNWHNYFFEDEVTITLTNISEKLNNENSLVYECPRNGERREIPHAYNAEEGTYTFVLSKGLHHIDISLVDEAGNEWNINRVKYLRVGNFRLYVFAGVFFVITAIGGSIVWRKRKQQA